MAIDGNDIVKDDALDNHIAQLKEVLSLNKQIDAQIIKRAKDTKKASTQVGAGKEAKGIRDLTKALSESELAKRAALKIDREKQKLDIQLKALNSDKIQQNEELKRQVRDQAKTNKELAESTRKLVGTEEKLIAANKKLLAERKKLDTSTKQGSRRLKTLNAQLDRNNKVLEKNSDKLGKQRIGIGRYSKAIGGLRSGLAQLGLAFGVFTLIKDSFNIIKDFDQAQANLSSVLGVTRESMSALTEQAKQLGATTKFTASQVSELQLEYAKLGFTQKEIDNVTESTLQLAAAAGTELANAATITGSTLRGFGLDTTETQRVVDVMAKSFSASSLDIDKFKVAMAAAAPVAKTFGFSIEETTALIGTLTDRGIDASAAGTGLRNMFLDANKAGITFQEALDKINNSTDKAGTSFDLFGKRGATLGVILAENQSATKGLTATLNDAGGAAKEMADKQLNTLQGSLDLLRSAWEGFILGADGAGGASEKLKNIVKFLAENLNTILNTIGAIIGAFTTYKIITAAVGVAQKAMVGITKLWTAAQWLLNIALNANPIGIIIIAVTALIAGIVALIKWMDSWTTSTKELTAEQKRNNLVNKQALSIGRELLKQNKEEIADVSVLIDALMDENTTREEKAEIIAKLNEDYPELLANIDLETASTEQLIAVKKQLITQILNQAIEQKKAEALAILTGQIIDKELKKIGAGERGVKQLQKEIDELVATIPIIEDIAKKVKENVQSTVEGLDLSSAFREENDKIRELQEKLRLLNIEFQNATTDDQREALNRRIEKVREALNKELGLRKQMLDDALDKEKQTNADSVDDADKSSKKKIDEKKKELDDLLELQELQALQLENLLIDQGKKQEEITEELNLQRVGFLLDQLILIRKLYGEETILFQKTLLEFNRLSKEAIEVTAEDVKNAVDEVADALEGLGEGVSKDANKARKKELDELKKFRDESLAIVEEITDGIVQNIDKRIEERQREIDESKNEVERLKDLAAQGNVEAAKSIKAEQVAQAKEKLEIERLQKQKKNLLISVAFLTESIRLIEAGDGNAFANASSKLSDFLENLPKASEGTDYNVAQTFGKANKSGTDGHLTWVDGKEKIMSIDNSNKLSGMHQDEVTRRALAYENNLVSTRAMGTQEAQMYTDYNIVQELKANTQAIKEMEFPTSIYDSETGEETRREGNKTTIYHHKPSTFRI